MKRKMVWVGSVGAGVILVLAMLSSVVGAETIKSDEKRTNLIQFVIDKIAKNNLPSGGIIDTIQLLIFAIILITIAFLQGQLYF
ncbi:MAG: hypothetical protein V1726_04025 [Methanobacteriota archaeon]